MAEHKEYIREFSLYQGYNVYFADIGENEMLNASIASFICDYEKLERLFNKVNSLMIICIHTQVRLQGAIRSA